MWAKLSLGAAAVLAAALFAFLGDRLIAAYGDARHAAGVAEERSRQLPAILAANARAAQAGFDARDRLIAAERDHAAEAVRLAALIRQSDDEVSAYEADDSGRADCLAADRVHAIEANRAALFPAAPREAPGDGDPRSLPAEPARQTGGGRAG